MTSFPLVSHVLLAVLIFTTAQGADEPKPLVIRAPDAAKRVGDTVIVEGLVTQVSVTATGTFFLNFGGRYPNQVFTAAIFKAETSQEAMKRKYEGQRVQVEGKVTLYKEKPEIRLKRWADIRVPTTPVFKD